MSPEHHEVQPVVHAPPPRSAIDRADAWLRGRAGASRLRFSLLVAFAIVLVYNLRFWRETLAAAWQPDVGGALFIAALALILVAVHVILLTLIPGRRGPPLVAAALFIAASIIAYFADTYGVYYDADMLRNIYQTDAAETADLLSPRLFAYLGLLGILPALWIGRVQLPAQTWLRRIASGAGTIAGMLAVIGLLAVSTSAHLASFLREHKPLRYLINPMNVVYGTVRYALDTRRADRPFEDLNGAVARLPGARSEKPLLVFLVVGETARAANFELDGYTRATNPELTRVRDLVWFGQTRSCGTSTATSVPCMFSPLGREAFDVDIASSQSNLLDAAKAAGIDVTWHDNNSGCKGVCARVSTVTYPTPDADAEAKQWCADGHCFDEVMLQDLRERLLPARGDALHVFHQVGSHGPAYFERYPPAFETFKPACRSPELGRCAREAVVNAYDNTILYTDHNLAEQVALLRSLEGEYDSLLLYVSDHGESLGEKGLYLHAAPYFIAPDEQTRVPMVLWMSEGYRTRSQTDLACTKARAARAASHDDLYHTVLAALGVHSAAYRRDRDLLAGCRRGW